MSFLPDEETARFEVKSNNSTPALFSPSLLGLAERRAGIGKRELESGNWVGGEAFHGPFSGWLRILGSGAGPGLSIIVKRRHKCVGH